MSHKKVILLITILNTIVSVFTSDKFKYLDEESFLYGIATTSVDHPKNSQCYKDLQHFMECAQKNEPWVLRMLDSSGALEQGYLFGHTLWMGLKSECEDIPNNRGLILQKDQIFPQNNFPPFEIIFMSVVLNHNNTVQSQFRIPVNNYLHVGLCMPNSCTDNDLIRLLEQFLNRKKLLFQKIYPVQLNLSNVKSLRADQIDWYTDPMVLILIIFVGLTLILTIVRTWYDIFVLQPKIKNDEDVIIKQSDEVKIAEKSSLNNSNENNQIEPNLFLKIALCYSILRNTQGIFTIKKEPKFSSLPFIHGIKTWGMLYIVLLHGVLYQNIFVDNAYSAYRLGAMFFNQILSNPSYSVDTFFCLGGFLLSYLFYKVQKEHNRKITVLEGIALYFKMVFHRYMRLTPAYFVVLFLSYSFWQMVGQEYPLIQKLPMEKMETACPQYWWRNMLYITTYYTREDMCLTWSWYMSNDMQYFLAASFLLLISSVYLKPVLNIFYFLIVVSIVVGGWTSYIHKYVPTLEEQILQLEVIYYPLLIRMSPYFVGVLAGYYIHQWNYKIPLDKATINKISWAALIIDLYIIHGVYTKDNLPNLYISIYMGISRTLWGITMAWLIMICISGDAGIINKFLSFPGWVPLSRLTYCLYLIHPILILLFGYTSDRPVHMSYSIVITSAIGIFTLSIFAAFILCLLFESPYILLLKMCLYSQSVKKTEKKCC